MDQITLTRTEALLCHESESPLEEDFSLVPAENLHGHKLMHKAGRVPDP